MNIVDLYRQAFSQVYNKPGIKLNSQDHKMQLIKAMSRINADNGSPIPQHELYNFAVNNIHGKSKEETMWKYLPETFWNEYKYQRGGIKPLVNAVSDTFTLGMGPRWEYGANENDKYLDPSMIKTREVLTAIGENAAQLAIPTSVAGAGSKILSAGSKANKAIAASRNVAAAAKKMDRAIQTGDGIVKAVKPVYNAGKWGVNNLILDQNNFNITGTLKNEGIKATAKKFIAPAINVGWGGVVDSNIIGNQANFHSGRLTDDQWIALGIDPDNCRDIVSKYGDEWMDHVKIDPAAASDMKYTGKVLVNKKTTEPSNPQANKEPSSTSKPWYHHAAVGYGSGAIGGGATGYLLSTLLGADTAGKVMSTVGGGLAGSFLGRYVQQKMLES